MADTRDDYRGDFDATWSLEELEGGELLVVLGDCAALGDDPRGPFGLLTTTPDSPGFEHMAQAVKPLARVAAETPPAGAAAAWRVWIDSSADPVPPHPLAELLNANDITTFDLSPRPRTPVEITRRTAHAR